MLPNFFIIGAMKSGTTTLYHLLKCHPDVFMAEIKEPDFFCNEKNVASSMTWYESLFTNATNEKAIGEASTNYTKHPIYRGVPQRIKTHIPGAKLIYLIRNPVDRIYSQFTHNYYLGKIDNDLTKVITQNQNYINISRYHMQLQHYLEIFDKNQIKVVLLEDLRDRPKEVIKDIYEFLGVDPAFLPKILNERKHQTINKSGQRRFILNALRKLPFYKSTSNRIPESIKGKLNALFRKKVDSPCKMTAKERDYLLEELKSDVLALQSYLNRDLSAWLQ